METAKTFFTGWKIPFSEAENYTGSYQGNSLARLLYIVKSFIFYWGLLDTAEQTNVQRKGLSNTAHKRPSDLLPVRVNLSNACTQKSQSKPDSCTRGRSICSSLLPACFTVPHRLRQCFCVSSGSLSPSSLHFISPSKNCPYLCQRSSSGIAAQSASMVYQI